MTGELAELAHTMRVDAAAAEAIAALHDAGIRPVLLKGPAIAERLYPDAPRTYVDTDLLITPRDRDRAERVLAGLGYGLRVRSWESPDRVEHDATWRRPGDSCVIDLHRTLPALGNLSDRRLWRALRPHVVTRTLPEPLGSVDVLDDAGLAMLLALHAAHHLRGEVPRPETAADVRRAIAAFPPATWEAAGKLARKLRAERAVRRGLAVCV